MLLERADSKTPIQTNPPRINPEAQEIEYNIEQILDQQKIDDQTKYLIKWKGYKHHDNTWKLEEHFNCLSLLRDFRKQNPADQEEHQTPLRRSTKRNHPWQDSQQWRLVERRHD